MRKLGRKQLCSETHHLFCREMKLPSEKVELAACRQRLRLLLDWMNLLTVALQTLGLQLVEHADYFQRLLASCVEGIGTANRKRGWCFV